MGRLSLPNTEMPAVVSIQPRGAGNTPETCSLSVFNEFLVGQANGPKGWPWLPETSSNKYWQIVGSENSCQDALSLQVQLTRTAVPPSDRPAWLAARERKRQ
jgi:hypothetical protein